MIRLIYNRKLAWTHAIWMTMVKIPRDFIVKGDGGRGRGGGEEKIIWKSVYDDTRAAFHFQKQYPSV